MLNQVSSFQLLLFVSCYHVNPMIHRLGKILHVVVRVRIIVFFWQYDEIVVVSIHHSVIFSVRTIRIIDIFAVFVSIQYAEFFVTGLAAER